MTRAGTRSEDKPACWHEADRLSVLHSYDILDTPPELAFDDITKLAALVCATPIAVINFVESTRQWFKAEIGLGVRETPLDLSICAHALLQKGLFVVPDLTQDARFACNPLVVGKPHLRFYAGALLETTEGLPLGTLCVLDHQRRLHGLTQAQGEALLSLARQVMTQLEQNRLARRLALREAELTEGEQKFRAVSDSIDQIVWSTRSDGFHDFYNRRWYEFTGVPEGSTDGEAWNSVFHQDDQDHAWSVWQHCLTTGEPYHIEYRLRHRSGQYRWVLGRAQAIRDKLGRITRWYGTCTNIHDLKTTQGALTESEARFRKLIEASPVGIAIGDLEGGYSYGNPAIQHLLGYSADEFAHGQVPWRGITPPEWAHKDDEAVRQLRTLGVSEQFEKEYIAKDGRRVPILVGGAMVERVGEGGEDVAAYVVDLTALKQAEADLRDREAILSGIFQSAGLYTGVVELLDDDVLYVMVNERCAEFFGRSVAEMQGMCLGELGMMPEAVAHWLAFMRECYAKAGPTVLEFPFENSGEIRHYLGTFTPLPAGPSKRPRLALVSLDISDRKRLEEQQVLISGELHHRVKNTLTIVQALVSSAARYATTIAEFQQSVTDRIASLAKTHTLLINDHRGGAALKDILLAELAPYDDEIGQRVQLEGPDLHLPSETALAVSMAVHELTTNAAKHGVFSLPSGRVHVAWTLERTDSGERLLTLAWDEHDGPLVQEPTRKGFGSVLLQRVLGRQLGGQIEVTYAQEGLRVRLTALLPKHSD